VRACTVVLVNHFIFVAFNNQILDLRTTMHVHAALEARGLLGERGKWSMACHPTRPILAIAKFPTGVFLWNYTTYG
jgi:hypothetical protein